VTANVGSILDRGTPHSGRPVLAPSMVEALALAVTEDAINPRALMLNTDNTPDRWASLSEALDSGSALAVTVAPWVLALDEGRA